MKWTQPMDDFLSEAYATHGCRYVAQALQMNESTVASRAHFLGVKSARTKVHSLADCEAMLAEYPHKTIGQIAKERGLTRSQAQWCIRRAQNRRAA